MSRMQTGKPLARIAKSRFSARAAAGLKCPACGGHQHGVYDSRHVNGTHRRRRVCPCGHRFTTVESVETRYRAQPRISDPVDLVKWKALGSKRGERP